MKIFFWLSQMRENQRKQEGEHGKVQNGDSRVVWTGPSVRVRDGRALLNSEEMKRDLAAVRRLRERGFIES